MSCRVQQSSQDVHARAGYNVSKAQGILGHAHNLQNVQVYQSKDAAQIF